jgi:hypothetical protein
MSSAGRTSGISFPFRPEDEGAAISQRATRGGGTRRPTSIDETHRNVKLLNVELPSVVDISERPEGSEHGEDASQQQSSRLDVLEWGRDSPDLGHVVPAQTALPKHLLSDLAGDEAAPGLIPSSEDLVVVLLLVFGKDPGDFGRLDRLVLSHLTESRRRGKRSALARTIRRGKMTYEVHRC